MILAQFTGLDDATPLQNWEIVSAFVLPLVISFIVQSGWSRAAQSVAAFAVSAVWTVIALALRGELAGNLDTVATILKVFALTIPFYYGVWKPTGVAPAIEAKTSF